jgi:hypothetical protein
LFLRFWLKFLGYLFPPIHLRQKLPLHPLGHSTNMSRHEITPRVKEAARLFKAYSVARTEHDAAKLLAAYPGATELEIIKWEKRKRKREHRLVKAWHRLVALW